MPENTLTVEFRLVGQRFDPEEINRKLGINYTECQLSDGKTYSFWILSKTAREHIKVSEVCNEIVDQLIPKQEEVLELIQQYDLRPGFSLELYQRPRTDHERMYGRYFVTEMAFDPRLLKFLGAIGAPLFFETDCECM